MSGCKVFFAHIYQCRGETHARAIEKGLHEELKLRRTNGGTEWFEGGVCRTLKKISQRNNQSVAWNLFPACMEFMQNRFPGSYLDVEDKLREVLAA